MAAPIKLTAETAFAAAFALTEVGREVNSNSLWARAGHVGSRGTALKWAKLWNAFAAGEEVAPKHEKLRVVYEAIAGGGDGGAEGGETVATEDDEPIPQIQGATEEYAWTLSEVVRAMIAERTAQIAESSASAVHAEQERAAQAIVAAAQERDAAQEALASKEREYLTLEQEVLTLREQLGSAEAKSEMWKDQRKSFARKAEELDKQLKDWHAKNVRLMEQKRALEEKVDEAQERLTQAQQSAEAVHAEHSLTLKGLRQELLVSERMAAVAGAESESLRQQLGEVKGRGDQMEARNAELSATIATLTGEARAAEERVRHLEEWVAAIQGELATLRAEKTSDEATDKGVTAQ